MRKNLSDEFLKASLCNTYWELKLMSSCLRTELTFIVDYSEPWKTELQVESDLFKQRGLKWSGNTCTRLFKINIMRIAREMRKILFIWWMNDMILSLWRIHLNLFVCCASFIYVKLLYFEYPYARTSRSSFTV